MASDLSAGAGPAIQCLVVTPERTVLDERAEFVALPLYDGELGLFPGHSPLIARLGYGELRTGQGAAAVRYFVDGGFAQFRDDVLTVLTSRAIEASRIDPAAVEAELAQALARTARSDLDLAEKERAIARARAQARLVERED